MVDVAYKLLLIEDDAPLAELIADYLSDFEFEVIKAHTGQDALTLVEQNTFDLIICDVMLPDIEGFDLLPHLAQHQHCPLLFLTALSDNVSQIKGLNLGSCDYIVKPVEPELLLARIRANIRLQENRNQTSLLTIGDLKLDRANETGLYKEVNLELTHQEFEILWFFGLKGEVVIDKDTVFSEVIGRPYDGKDRAADLRFSRLRKKLTARGYPELTVDSIRNRGYLFKYWAHIS